MTDTTTQPHEATTPLWSDDRIIDTVHNLGLRDNSPRINIDDAIDKMVAIRDEYEAELATLRAEIAQLRRQLAEQEAANVALMAQEWSKLWGDEPVQIALERAEIWKKIATDSTMGRVAADLIAQVADLQQQLAEREAWEVVPDDVREAIGAALNLAFANCGKYDHAEKEQITLASAWLEQAP